MEVGSIRLFAAVSRKASDQKVVDKKGMTMTKKGL